MSDHCGRQDGGIRSSKSNGAEIYKSSKFHQYFEYYSNSDSVSQHTDSGRQNKNHSRVYRPAYHLDKVDQAAVLLMAPCPRKQARQADIKAEVEKRFNFLKY